MVSALLSQWLSHLRCIYAYGQIDRLASHPGGGGGVEFFLVISSYRDRDEHWPDGTHGSYADFTHLRRRKQPRNDT